MIVKPGNGSIILIGEHGWKAVDSVSAEGRSPLNSGHLHVTQVICQDVENIGQDEAIKWTKIELHSCYCSDEHVSCRHHDIAHTQFDRHWSVVQGDFFASFKVSVDDILQSRYFPTPFCLHTFASCVLRGSWLDMNTSTSCRRLNSRFLVRKELRIIHEDIDLPYHSDREYMFLLTEVARVLMNNLSMPSSPHELSFHSSRESSFNQPPQDLEKFVSCNVSFSRGFSTISWLMPQMHQRKFNSYLWKPCAGSSLFLETRKNVIRRRSDWTSIWKVSFESNLIRTAGCDQLVASCRSPTDSVLRTEKRKSNLNDVRD